MENSLTTSTSATTTSSGGGNANAASQTVCANQNLMHVKFHVNKFQVILNKSLYFYSVVFGALKSHLETNFLAAES